MPAHLKCQTCGTALRSGPCAQCHGAGCENCRWVGLVTWCPNFRSHPNPLPTRSSIEEYRIKAGAAYTYQNQNRGPAFKK
jgi:hypothetical protein